MVGGRVCVVTDSLWVCAKLRREASSALEKAGAGAVGGGVVATIGHLKAHSYALGDGGLGEAMASAVEALGLSLWSERTFLGVYIRRATAAPAVGRFFLDGALRAEEIGNGREAWVAFEVLCGRVGLDCAAVFGDSIRSAAA